MIGVNLEKYDNFLKIINFISYLINFLTSLHSGKRAALQSVTLLTFTRLNGCFSRLVVMGMLLQEPYSCFFLLTLLQLLARYFLS